MSLSDHAFGRRRGGCLPRGGGCRSLPPWRKSPAPNRYRPARSTSRRADSARRRATPTSSTQELVVVEPAVPLDGSAQSGDPADVDRRLVVGGRLETQQGRYLLWSDIPNNRSLRWLEDDAG